MRYFDDNSSGGGGGTGAERVFHLRYNRSKVKPDSGVVRRETQHAGAALTRISRVSRLDRKILSRVIMRARVRAAFAAAAAAAAATEICSEDNAFSCFNDD